MGRPVMGSFFFYKSCTASIWMSECSWFLSRIKLKRNKSTKITAEISFWQHVPFLFRPEVCPANKVDSFVSQFFFFFLSLFLPFSARRTP